MGLLMERTYWIEKVGVRRRKERLWDGLLIELKKRCAGGEEW
jgi:hypothetical protein